METKSFWHRLADTLCPGCEHWRDFYYGMVPCLLFCIFMLVGLAHANKLDPYEKEEQRRKKEERKRAKELKKEMKNRS